MSRLPVFFLLMLAIDVSVWAEMSVSSDFPGGSAEVIAIDPAQQTLHIQPQVQPDHGWPCWWYCRLDGLSVGKSVRVSVSANAKPYRGHAVLNRSWLAPDRASISDDNHRWRPVPQSDRDGGAVTYRFNASSKTMWIAWGPPYLPAHSSRSLTECVVQLPTAEVFELARTRNGRPVMGIRLGTIASPDAMKPAVWIQARQHAWEAGSSWVAEGFLRWATSEDPIAIELRRKATILVIPIMDVDRVAEGAGGKDSVPRDHNRDWDDAPVYPEVAAAQARILDLHRTQRFDLFVDLHNPGPNDRRPFFYAPKMEALPSIQQRSFQRWKEISRDQIGELESEFRFTSYIKTQEERDRVSSNWVRNHTSPHVVSLTLETAWNRPEGTQQGYQTVGKQLGLSIARYLDVDPNRD